MRAEVVVFGRWPTSGGVKTRLARAIGPAAACSVYRALLDHALSEAQAFGFSITLALAGAPERADWEAPSGVRVVSQVGGDLGARMQHAFAERFADGADAVVLLGSDLPNLSGDLIATAVNVLGRVPVVLGPAADGGYWTLGQRSPGYDLFSGVPWSSPETAAVTRERLAVIEIPFEELPVLRDIDTVTDLESTLVDHRLDEALRLSLQKAIQGR